MSIGASVAFHLARFGAGRVLLVERDTVGAGTTSQSSGILRTHYSVKENVELARRSWDVFRNFAQYLGDEDASSGIVQCGYLICAADDEGVLQFSQHRPWLQCRIELPLGTGERAWVPGVGRQ